VDDEAFRSIRTLPDDVSVTTWKEHRAVIERLWSDWEQWICPAAALQDTVGDPTDSPIAHVAVIAADELQASLYNALVGFYRVAFSSLRNVVEQVTIGLHLELAHDLPAFRDWLGGGRELSFGWAADGAPGHPPVAQLEALLTRSAGDDLFRQKRSGQDPGGFARSLFGELSNFTHGKPSFTDFDIWESNGPIFVAGAFENWVGASARVYALATLEVKLGSPGIDSLGLGSPLRIEQIYHRALALVPVAQDGLKTLQAVPASWWK
jgi:hypothetical protein